MSPAQPGQDNLANVQETTASLSSAALDTHQAFEPTSLTGNPNTTISVPVYNLEIKVPKAPEGNVHKKKKRGISYQQRMYEAMKAKVHKKKKRGKCYRQRMYDSMKAEEAWFKEMEKMIDKMHEESMKTIDILEREIRHPGSFRAEILKQHQALGTGPQ